MALPMLGLAPQRKEKTEAVIAAGCLPEYARTASLLASRAALSASHKATLFAPLRKTGDSGTVMIETARALRTHYGAAILLVEMQLERPSFTKRFGLKKDALTLRDVAEGQCAVSDALTDAGENLCVLPVSSGSGARFDIAPLVRRVVSEMTPAFGFILIEAPPVADSADVLALLPTVPQLVLVMESGVASSRTVASASDTLRSAGAEILGTVLQSRRPILPSWLRRRFNR